MKTWGLAQHIELVASSSVRICAFALLCLLTFPVFVLSFLSSASSICLIPCACVCHIPTSFAIASASLRFLSCVSLSRLPLSSSPFCSSEHVCGVFRARSQLCVGAMRSLPAVSALRRGDGEAGLLPDMQGEDHTVCAHIQLIKIGAYPSYCAQLAAT